MVKKTVTISKANISKTFFKAIFFCWFCLERSFSRYFYRDEQENFFFQKEKKRKNKSIHFSEKNWKGKVFYPKKKIKKKFSIFFSKILFTIGTVGRFEGVTFSRTSSADGFFCLFSKLVLKFSN